MTWNFAVGYIYFYTRSVIVQVKMPVLYPMWYNKEIIVIFAPDRV